MKKCVYLFALLIISTSCRKHEKKQEVVDLATGPSSTTTCKNTYSETNDVQIEKDKIFSLLSLAAVYKNWQTPETNPVRGYNIGSVLIAPSGQVVKWARNCVDTTANSTQHGEVRLMTSYLGMTQYFSLKNEDDNPYTLYTSLEPCAMCSGMMTLQSLNRTVYSQTDPDFGKAIQRLEFDAADYGGCPPYPRAVISDVSPSIYRYMLDTAYVNYLRKGYDRSITKFLTTENARVIYSSAVDELLNYQVTYPENQSALNNAISYYNNIVSDTYTPLDDDNDLVTTVFTVKGASTTTGITDIYKTYGGDLYQVSNIQVFTTLNDIDGDVFFTIINSANPSEYAIIDSGANINTGAALVNVMYQYGVSCSVTREKEQNGVYYFTINTVITHDNDCKWNGSECEPI
ncbi:nucleoside deaminase [Flavivirga rizhaonensis]|uniref:Nucleoside deaminase n=1 Tax=Flavivirga rizhaonensis TaxID=2559571 RepID=A0A4V3P4I6_9FLAO|nr:nucleoside deaminase [Flavivirga rizhaonensis]TGV01554.1 nucleoside deaminase [Flavivirga rizhaonensis]